MRSNTTTLWDLPLSRRLDPVTSFEAAEELQASGQWQRQKSLVLDALRQHPGMR